jgi:hypothetical protein
MKEYQCIGRRIVFISDGQVAVIYRRFGHGFGVSHDDYTLGYGTIYPEDEDIEWEFV